MVTVRSAYKSLTTLTTTNKDLRIRMNYSNVSSDLNLHRKLSLEYFKAENFMTIAKYLSLTELMTQIPYS